MLWRYYKLSYGFIIIKSRFTKNDSSSLDGCPLATPVSNARSLPIVVEKSPSPHQKCVFRHYSIREFRLHFK